MNTKTDLDSLLVQAIVPLLRSRNGDRIQGDAERSHATRRQFGHRHHFPQRFALRGGTARRRLLRTGNYDLTNTHFTWVMDAEIETATMAASMPSRLAFSQAMPWFKRSPV